MRIQNKLYIAFLLSGIGLVVLMLVLMQWSLSKGLVEFVNQRERAALAPVIEKLVDGYRQNGDWEWIADEQRQFHRIFRSNADHSDEHRPPPRSHRPPPRGEHPPKHQRQHQRRSDRKRGPDHQRAGPPGQDIILYDADKNYVVGKKRLFKEAQWLPINDNQQIIGYIVTPARHGLTKGYELTLLEQQRYQFLLISLLLSVLTVIIAMPLARHLVRPIARLAKSMAQLTKGNYQERITINRNDELGYLARDVNELAITLENNDTARKRWLADISHELRTPIAVMKSEMEAVIDDIRPLNKDVIHSTYQETQRLQRLVEDLYELCTADIGGMKYKKQSIDIEQFLLDESDHYQHLLAANNSQLKMEFSAANKSATNVWGDCDRLSQLLSNLMTNCAKYGKENGIVELSLKISTEPANEQNAQQTKYITMIIDDDGPGVSEQHLDKLFEHLYRVDNSRNRQTGGSGLGLAICQQIVHAHQGSIAAQKSPLGGLRVMITLPLSDI